MMLNKNSTKIIVFALILTLISLALLSTVAGQHQDEDEQVTVTSEADEPIDDHQQPVSESKKVETKPGEMGLSRFDRFFDDIWEDWPSPSSFWQDLDLDLDRDFDFGPWSSRLRNLVMDLEDGFGSNWPIMRRSWFDGLRRARDRLMDRFRSLDRPRGGTRHGHRRAAAPSFRARADLKQVGDNYELTIDVPGMDKKDINIQLKEKVDPWSNRVVDVLEISGEHKEESRRVIEGQDGHQKIDAPQQQEKIADKTGATPPTREGQKEEKKDDEHKYIWTERTIGQFQRTVALPKRIIKDKIRAKLDNGVLTVVMPIDLQKHEEEPAVTNIAIE